MADNLLQEVDDALRADRAGALWAKHRSTIIAVVVALVLGTAINSGWQHYRQVRGAKVMLQLSENQQLLDAGKAKEAADGFGAIAAARSGELRDLARVWQARALVSAGDKAGAIAVLKTAAEDGKSLWSDIACLRLAGLDAAAATCLSAAHASPLAAERAQWAAAELWSNGKQDAAIVATQTLIDDEETSQEARAQLTQWLATMNAQKKDAK